MAISGRDRARLASTLEALAGEGHVTIAADLDRQEDIDHLVAHVGVLDGMAHAAGISRLVPLRLVNRAHLDDMFSSNTFAPMLLTRGLLAKTHRRARLAGVRRFGRLAYRADGQ